MAICLLLAGCGQDNFQTDGQSVSASEESAAGYGQEAADAKNAEDAASIASAEENTSETALELEGETSYAGDMQDIQETVSSEITIVMVGDILLHMPVEESANRADGSRDFSPIFANLTEEIGGADLALVNQEVIIGGEELGISGYPAFNAPCEIGDALVEAGFDVVCHATNHALDKGKRGLLNCLAFWGTQYPDMAVLGIAESQAERDEIYVYEQDGIKIAILNYTYGTNGIALPEDMPYGVNLLQEEQVLSDLQRANQEADFVIVCPHWGTEYNLGISAEQERWTQIFLENGVDLVLGTHPHVIEPIEWVEDADSGRETLVYYSLGNFVNWTSGQGDGVANRMVGGMAQVTVGQNEQGDVCVVDYGVLPLVCHVESGFGGVRVYALEDYSQELAEQNVIVEQDPHFSLEYCLELCQEVWGLE
ncbi:MAG: CapA family protein [Candidatus Gastranaerophilales bacterium]|nr:CapA family protein [Candidatus Gastranaerophilales bacterium]